jgi:large subunit ribosomal protein L22
MAEVKAKISRLDIAPRKARAIVRIMTGLSVGDAEAQLMFRKERAARPVLKLLKSAVANARVKGMDASKLVIKTAFVDKGPRMKRWLPRARGMATPIHKDFSHVTIILAESDKKSRFTISMPEAKKAEKGEAPKAKRVSSGKKPKKVDTKKETKESVKTEAAPAPLKKVFRRKSV